MSSGVDGKVGANCGVGGGAQLGLIFNAGAVHAAGEIDQRFLLLDVGELRGDGAQGLEAAVGVEDVELGVVGGERAAGVGGAFGGAGAAGFEALACCLQLKECRTFCQEARVGGEVLVHRQRVARARRPRPGRREPFVYPHT